jgi:hypothetical protein
MRYAERLRSTLEASKFVVVIGRKSKTNSAFLVRYLRVLLLRHIAFIRELRLLSFF